MNLSGIVTFFKFWNHILIHVWSDREYRASTFCNSSNIAKGLKMGNMTRESILRKDPDIIIIATMGGFGKVEKEAWESYSQMKASKHKKVFLINSNICCSPTPENFVIALEEVYHFIND